MAEPWKDWLPGVLSKAQMRELVSEGAISTETGSSPELDSSAMDLTLGNRVWKMSQGSVKPNGGDYQSFLAQKSDFAESIDFTNDELELETRQPYVFKLNEKLGRPLRQAKSFYGRATGKSSVGRVDVLTRLIVENMDHYEGFRPESIEGSDGAMFLEVTPMTFPVKVRVGTSLSQLRLFYGAPQDSEIRGKELFQTVLRAPNSDDGGLSVDLALDEYAPGRRASAFKATRQEENKTHKPIELWGPPNARPEDYWEPVPCDGKRLRIENSHFYILRSKERLALTRGVAVYCRASDEALGEMRMHYAGFVHPGFGTHHRAESDCGTPLIFEVRGHDVDIVLNDAERLANLHFYRMSQDCDDEDIVETPYHNQNLKLSKFFEEWT
jgi:dCTP deaminase